MAYTPNPADITQPTDATDASTADDEFRALKAYIQTIVSTSGAFAFTRQSTLTGHSDINGQADYLQAPITPGLAVDLKATGAQLVLSFANGFGGIGQADNFTILTADTANVITGLFSQATNFISATYLTGGTVTWATTLVPPQYERAYNQKRQSLVPFVGANGAVTTLDSYGNTVTMTNTTLDTSQFVPGVGASSCLFNSGTDVVDIACNELSKEDSWTMELFFRMSALPGIGTVYVIQSYGAADFGASVNISNTAGVIKTGLFLSSNAAANDLANAVLGAKVAWNANQWYHLALVFDALVGKYFVYIDGVLDTTVATATKVHNFSTSKIRLGLNHAGTNPFAGWMQDFRKSPCCRYPNGTAFTVPITPFPLEGDWFDINEMKMKIPSAASTIAGNNPTFTASKKLYVGEADTSAVTAVLVRPYAFRGVYVSSKVTPLPGNNIRTMFNANIGTFPLRPIKLWIQNLILDANYAPGMILEVFTSTAAGVHVPFTFSMESRNLLGFTTGAAVAFEVINKTTGVHTPVAAGSWSYFIAIDRGW